MFAIILHDPSKFHGTSLSIPSFVFVSLSILIWRSFVKKKTKTYSKFGYFHRNQRFLGRVYKVSGEKTKVTTAKRNFSRPKQLQVVVVCFKKMCVFRFCLVVLQSHCFASFRRLVYIYIYIWTWFNYAASCQQRYDFYAFSINVVKKEQKKKLTRFS